MDKNIFEIWARERAMEAYTLTENIAKNIRGEQKDTKETPEILKNREEKLKHLKSVCRQLPVMIHENGLLITLLYLHKKKENKSDKRNRSSVENQLFQGIVKWLQRYMQALGKEKNTEEDFLRYLAVNCEEREKRFLMKEAIAFTVWMKRCAERV